MMRIKVNFNEKGFSLVEVLVSVAIIGILIPSFVIGLSTASKALTITDERETAKNLAESQMEYVMNQNYSSNYTAAPIPSEYAGYNVTITTVNVPFRDSNIQKINVNVTHLGRTIILTGNSTLEDYKEKR